MPDFVQVTIADAQNRYSNKKWKHFVLDMWHSDEFSKQTATFECGILTQKPASYSQTHNPV